MYFDGDAADDRKQAALEELGEFPDLDREGPDRSEDGLDERIRQIVREELQTIPAERGPADDAS